MRFGEEHGEVDARRALLLFYGVFWEIAEGVVSTSRGCVPFMQVAVRF